MNLLFKTYEESKNLRDRVFGKILGGGAAYFRSVHTFPCSFTQWSLFLFHQGILLLPPKSEDFPRRSANTFDPKIY